MPKNGQELNPKRERFCQEYLKDQNATQAAVRAGYSKKTANEQGSQLLAELSVKSRIAELMAPIVEEAGITLSEHLKSLKALRDRADAAEQFSAAITAEVSCGKASGLYVEKSEQKITVSVVSGILQAVDGKTTGLK